MTVFDLIATLEDFVDKQPEVGDWQVTMPDLLPLVEVFVATNCNCVIVSDEHEESEDEENQEV